MFDGDNPNFTTEPMNGNLPSEKNSFRISYYERTNDNAWRGFLFF